MLLTKAPITSVRHFGRLLFKPDNCNQLPLNHVSPKTPACSIEYICFCVCRKPLQSCDALLTDHETRSLLDRQFDLLILDGAYPECALALAHRLRAPFMYINTVGFYTGSLALAGNPSAYSVSPAFYSSYTDDMTLVQRTVNTVFHVFANVVHAVSII